jgi:lysophospholipase L1-like esterase
MRRTLIVAFTAATMMASGVVMGGPAEASGRDTYYVSLGDSAAAGFQPTGQEDRGYANQLFHLVRGRYERLRLVKLGCSGETSESLISGVDSPCSYPSGSQLDEATSFIRDHAGRIAFITVNVGVNDVLNRCFNDFTGVINPGCVHGTVPNVTANLASILEALRAAAPDVPIAGMSYWNPFLGYWIAGGPGHTVARIDALSMHVLNAGIVSTLLDDGALVADVAGASFFDTEDFTTVVATRWGRVPENVANACRWTWFCADPPFGGDPHPNTRGYGLIADAFAAVLPA